MLGNGLENAFSDDDKHNSKIAPKKKASQGRFGTAMGGS